MNAWFWVILAVVFVVIESLTLGLTTIWFAIGALLAFFMAWLDFSWQGQVMIFMVSALVLLYYTGPIARRYLKIGTTRTNVQALIGEPGLVIEKIQHVKHGQVEVNGQMWSAKASNNQEIEINEEIIIENIEGNSLIVRRFEKE